MEGVERSIEERTNRTIRRGRKCSNYNSSEEVGPLAIDAVGWWWNAKLIRDADMQYRKVYELGSGDVKRKREKKERRERRILIFSSRQSREDKRQKS